MLIFLNTPKVTPLNPRKPQFFINHSFIATVKKLNAHFRPKMADFQIAAKIENFDRNMFFRSQKFYTSSKFPKILYSSL